MDIMVHINNVVIVIGWYAIVYYLTNTVLSIYYWNKRRNIMKSHPLAYLLAIEKAFGKREIS